MEALIRDLLAQLGTTLDPPLPHTPCPGMTLLGRLSTPPGTRSGPRLEVGTHVWHAYDGWAPLDDLEIERWLVDAPEGTHWLLSERRLRLERRPRRDGVSFDIWGPERFAQWLGEAVLNGDLNAAVPAPVIEAAAEEEVERVPLTPETEGPTALLPQVDPQSTLRAHGLTSAEARPVLLCARIWSITGILRGPGEAAERHWWQLLEDPFTGEIDHLGQAGQMDHIPGIARLEPTRWVDQAELAPRLAGFCEERRHVTVTEGSGELQVQGSVLHWWRLDPSSAELTPRLAFLPAWQVRVPDRGLALLHGLTGQLLPMP